MTRSPRALVIAYGVLWIFVNHVYIGLYVYKSLLLTAVLYAIFAGLSVAGLVNWRRLLRRQEVGVTAQPT